MGQEPDCATDQIEILECPVCPYLPCKQRRYLLLPAVHKIPDCFRQAFLVWAGMDFQCQLLPQEVCVGGTRREGDKGLGHLRCRGILLPGLTGHSAWVRRVGVTDTSDLQVLLCQALPATLSKLQVGGEACMGPPNQSKDTHPSGHADTADTFLLHPDNSREYTFLCPTAPEHPTTHTHTNIHS